MLILVVAVAVIAATRMHAMHAAMAHYATRTTPALALVRQLQGLAAHIRMQQGQHLMTVSLEEMQPLETSIDDAFAQLQRAVTDQQNIQNIQNIQHTEHTLQHSPQEVQFQQAWQELHENITLQMTLWDKVRKVSRAAVAQPERAEEARRLFTGRSERVFRNMLHALDAQWHTHSQMAMVLAQQAAQAYERSVWLLALACLLAMTLGLVAAYGVLRSVIRQIGGEPQEVTQHALQMAAGDLRHRHTTSPVTEHSIAAAIQHMREALAQLVGQVRYGSSRLADVAAQIATANLDLNQRTESQARDLQHTVVAMNELTEIVKHNTDNAQQASALVRHASQAAHSGNAHVAQVVQRMQALASSSDTINDITTVIDAIAFQTNILSLNAAVEAARAGDQGRGFAVVAAEVRTLAQRSAQAAKEIRKLISSNIAQVHQAAHQMDEASRAIDGITTQVQRTDALVQDIHAASARQYEGIRQVSQAVARMDQATQHNAALVEHMSRAAHSQRELADQLTQDMAVFALDTPDPCQHADDATTRAAHVFTHSSPSQLP